MNKHAATLAEAYDQSEYPIRGNKKWTVQDLKDAFQEVDGSTVSDMYGKGSIMESFQQKIADILGMESAVFFPSGTMAQQIALRIWCDEAELKRVAYHPLCHLEIHEEDGLKELHHIEPVLLADRDRLIRLEDVQNMQEDIACLLLELPQREIGGQLPPFEELKRISAYCRSKGIKLHLDGARLFEVTPYYGKTAAEICALFDSVYVSFYKGIGGIAGAILAGPSAFTEKSKVWKRRHGGDLISLYPYVISSDYYFDKRIGKMADYYEGAKELAALYNSCSGVKTLPEVPVSNMFHVHFAMDRNVLETMLIEVYEESGVGLFGAIRGGSEGSCHCEINIGDLYLAAPKERVEAAFGLLRAKLDETAQA